MTKSVSFCGNEFFGTQVASETVMGKIDFKIKLFFVVSIFVVTLGFVTSAAAASLQQSQRSGATLEASFQYMLSNFSGPVASQWARLDFDPAQQEIYTLTQGFNEVRIFNPQGMEIFAFGGEGDIVSAVDLATGEKGDIYVLARNFDQYGIQALNYRGQPDSIIRIKNLPEKYQIFSPDRLEYQNGSFILLDSANLLLVWVQSDGAVIAIRDMSSDFKKMAKEIDPENKKTIVFDISGFGLGPDGTVYFTVPTLFSAFRLAPGGELESFGDSGSGPGKFGVVSGITADSQGNIYVADRLRSVVLIFAADFTFLGEFGYRGDRQEDMLVPDDLEIDQQGQRIFVSQAANKGVGVYKISLRPAP